MTMGAQLIHIEMGSTINTYGNACKLQIQSPTIQ